MSPREMWAEILRGAAGSVGYVDGDTARLGRGGGVDRIAAGTVSRTLPASSRVWRRDHGAR